jgi:hypothetical protein
VVINFTLGAASFLVTSYCLTSVSSWKKIWTIPIIYYHQGCRHFIPRLHFNWQEKYTRCADGIR